MRIYLLVLALVCSGSSWAQRFTIQKVDHSAYPDVSVSLKTNDSSRIAEEQIQVQENEKPLEFYLSRESRDTQQRVATICFLIEVGGFTSERQVSAAKGAIRQLLTTVDKQAQISVAYFARPSSAGVVKTISSAFTRDFVSLSQDLSRLYRVGEDTPKNELFKAVYECLEYIQNKGAGLPNKQIILISTGNHTGSSPIALTHCVDKAKSDQVVINAVGLRSRNVNAVDNLKLLAQQTGGSYQNALSQTDISNALTRYTEPAGSVTGDNDPNVTVLTYRSPASSEDSNRVEVLVGEEKQIIAYKNPR